MKLGGCNTTHKLPLGATPFPQLNTAFKIGWRSRKARKRIVPGSFIGWGFGFGLPLPFRTLATQAVKLGIGRKCKNGNPIMQVSLSSTFIWINQFQQQWLWSSLSTINLIYFFLGFFICSKLPREQGSILYCTTGILLRWLVSDP